MLRLWILPLLLLSLPTSYHASRVQDIDNDSIKTSVFLSPPFFLHPGSVADKYYFNIPFPKGHIALKSFNAEVVDDDGVPVPLHETYLHHWVVENYYVKKNAQVDPNLSNIIPAGNAGVCMHTLRQYFGLGSETRRTSTWIPGRYAIEIGNLNQVPDGYQEGWVLNVHAIDTRGVKDRLGCTECKCDLYNVTENEHGQSLAKDYIGGLHCCYDQMQCQIREGFNGGGLRKLYLRYTVKWTEWDDTVLPVRIYIFDVTDSGRRFNGLTGSNAYNGCKVEYQVEPCAPEMKDNGKCVDAKKTRVAIPRGGDIVYGVAHQHSGGAGAALYGQDGRLLCTSVPTYGDGEEAGNEAGYIVGMSTCYPEPGSVKVADGEFLSLVSNYSSTQLHTGVMGLFYIAVAEPQTQSKSTMFFHHGIVPWTAEFTKFWWAFVLLVAVVAVIVGISYHRRNIEGYEAL